MSGIKRRRNGRLSNSLGRELARFVGSVVALAHPQKVILFGSRAVGRPRRDSDVDLCVLLKRRPKDRLISTIYAIERSFPLDLVVFSSDQVRWRLREGDFFLREILERGAVLYEAPHARVG